MTTIWAEPPIDTGEPPVHGTSASGHRSSARVRSARTRAILRRVGAYLLTLAVVVVVIFALPRVLPGDPLASYIDPDNPMTPEARAAMVRYYGLHRPLVEQFGHYLSGLAHGDLGESITYRAPVSYLIRRRLPWTLLLSSTALIASAVLSFTAGVDSAWRRGSFLDRRLMVLMTFLHAVPEYVIATFLLITLAVVAPVFPFSGASTPFTQDATALYKLGDVAYHLALPALALTLGMMGTKFLLVRNTTISVLGQDYMVLARAEGLPERVCKYRHAGRNVLLPFLAVLGMQTGVAVGGSVFVETAFAYPGMATLLLPAVRQLDYPLMTGCLLLLAVVVLTANLVVDLVSAAFDPRLGAE